VVLRGACNTPKWEFFLVSALFVALQIGHDDYWRIRLNARAYKAEESALARENKGVQS
jgi:hypothetical protein